MVEENLCPGCNRNPPMKHGRFCEWCWRRRIRERGVPWHIDVRFTGTLAGTLVIVALTAILGGLNVWVYLW